MVKRQPINVGGGVTRGRPRAGKCLFTAHELKSANSGDNSRIGLHALRTD